MYDKSFTVIPMDRLDYIRLTLRAKLKELEATTGEKFKIRTFFLGPRPKFNNPYSKARPASTRKSVATGAKIGIYKVTSGVTSWGDNYSYAELDRYI